MTNAEMLVKTCSWPKDLIERALDLFPKKITLDPFFKRSLRELRDSSLLNVCQYECFVIHPHNIKTTLISDTPSEYGRKQTVDALTHVTQAQKYGFRPFVSVAEMWTFLISFLPVVMRHEGTTFYLPLAGEEVRIAKLEVCLYLGLKLELLDSTNELNVSYATGQGGESVKSTFVFVKE